MGYNRENYARIREMYETKYKIAQDAADARRAETQARIPGLEEIDRQLSSVGMRIMAEALGAGENCADKIAQIRSDTERLRAQKEQMLVAAGYPADYTDVKYECEKCSDSGFVDGYMCECMKRELVMAGYESSGIANLLRTQSFDTFSLDYYKNNPEAHRLMSMNLDYLKRYADGFRGRGSENLLLMGGTGLGKTHLSSSVAKRVIERGYDVYYVSAINMLSNFEYQRFGSSMSAEVESTDRCFDCDLLIIDDLGTEITNQFSISVIYNLINTRLNTGKPTVVSTNLTQSELRQRYSDRITSRIFGEYRPIVFKGVDVRAQKIKMQ
ncbi:MAG: ATP-binding protein [Clostridia bacterium]|nr:ATP-binding protein [Clostridia bacterium]